MERSEGKGVCQAGNPGACPFHRTTPVPESPFRDRRAIGIIPSPRAKPVGKAAMICRAAGVFPGARKMIADEADRRANVLLFLLRLKPLVTACGWGVHAPETWGELIYQPGCSLSRSRVGGASIRLKRGAGKTPYAVCPGLSPSARFHAKTGAATGITPSPRTKPVSERPGAVKSPGAFSGVLTAQGGETVRRATQELALSTGQRLSRSLLFGTGVPSGLSLRPGLSLSARRL